MIIIPELETVLLQPPRTGTTSLRNAVLSKYPKAFLLYRHMEADGIPFGYTHWKRICQLRDPFERLQSMFYYMKNPTIKDRTCPFWVEEVMAAAAGSFDDWLMDKTHFTSPGTPNINMRPRDAIMWAGPDQKKSQWLWAKGCDGAIYLESMEVDALRHLEVDVGHTNKSVDKVDMVPSEIAHEFLNKYHSWDLEIYGGQHE